MASAEKNNTGDIRRKKTGRSESGGFLHAANLGAGIVGGLATAGVLAYIIYDHAFPHSSPEQKTTAARQILSGNGGGALNTLRADSQAPITPSIVPRPPLPVQPAVPIQEVESSGVRASLLAAEIRNGHLFLNISLHNKTASRIYVTDATNDNGQIAILSSGGHMHTSTVAQIATCNGDISGCLGAAYNTSVSRMRYIDTGGDLLISLDYAVGQDVGPNDTVAFSLELLVRFASSTPGGDPAAAVPVSLPFQRVPITR